MNPGRVASQRDIAGELVDLISKRQRLTCPRRQVPSIGCRLNRMG